MALVLRGHHLLCVHGFKGMGYSPEFVEKMSEVVMDIRNENKDFPIKIVADLDDTCKSCPNNGISKCVASENSNDHVLTMDRKVIEQLGLKDGETYPKSVLVSLTAAKVRPDDLDVICAGCSWLSYGVCKEGIADLRQMCQSSMETY
ncbi:hypothetical protein DFO73_113183 [Cytobacillus oceanisediminis]|uniref:DUF1284 domain-containing protein n=1 Tax=Cytobacillus oceanisediminis TaxID=665099 RepID=A0A2V2ZSY5_9BACI|nr:DUF1284 domain-containing protein [Cytobacillus oceanisediminis]PWW25582.1 hypothetical protein DFO73_113183 [Cytobacillus oceanisediminis]